MTDLLHCRAAIEEPPFTPHCDLDLFRPVQIKKREEEVHYVHLQVVEDYESEPFINTVRKLVNRGGAPLI